MSSMTQRSLLDDASDRTKALLADLWRRNRPTIEARLNTLDRAAGTFPLPAGLHAETQDVAHKLSGSLGMFGFDHGTTLARELENILNSPEPDARRLAEIASQLRAMLLPAS